MDNGDLLDSAETGAEVEAETEAETEAALEPEIEASEVDGDTVELDSVEPGVEDEPVTAH